MVLPKKGSRSITVDGRRYRYLWRDGTETFAIEDWEKQGQRLQVRIWQWKMLGPGLPGPSGAIVRQAIFLGLARGWDPGSSGPPVQLLPESFFPDYDPFWHTREPREQRQLLDLVLAQPESRDPRLVYADWLAERGDPRGELILLQCRESRTDAHESRIQELLSKYWKYWPTPARPIADYWAFRNGFIEGVTLASSPEPELWQELHRWEPVLEIDVPRVYQQNMEWLLQPTTRRVRLFNVLTFSALDTMLLSPHRRGLRSLALHSSNLSDEWVHRMAEDDGLVALESLSLANGVITEAGAKALLGSPHLTALKQLRLGTADFTQHTRRRMNERGWTDFEENWAPWGWA